MEELTLGPIKRVSGTVQLPGSKSITNRALLLAGLAEGVTELHQPLMSDDTRHMIQALQDLGCKLEAIPEGYRVQGVGGPFNYSHHNKTPLSLFLGNAGTAMRPLSAALALTRPDWAPGSVHLYGEPRMYERPIDDLVEPLRALGADISYLGKEGYPPLAIQNTGLAGGRVQLKADRSSQFLTALLMAAPLADSAMSIELTGELTSKPYIDLTIAVMARFGIAVKQTGTHEFQVEPSCYRAAGKLLIEGDATSASYFLAAGAIAQGPVRVLGIGQPALQGDVAFVEVLSAMGAKVSHGADWIEVAGGGPLKAVDMDLNHIPDAAMTLAVMALFAEGTTCIRNIANWRIKETDRIAAMATELIKLGAKVETTDDSIRIAPPEQIRSASIGTWEDHRMAMSFSLAALGRVPISLQDPGCVSKTFPDYFKVFSNLCQQ